MKKVGAFLKKHGKKIAAGGSLFLAGIAAGSKPAEAALDALLTVLGLK